MMLGFNLHTSKQSLSLESVTSITNAFKLLHGKSLSRETEIKEPSFFKWKRYFILSLHYIKSISRSCLGQDNKIPH